MDMLLTGVLLWSAVHYIPGLLPNLKIKLVDMLDKAYRGVFSLVVVGSIVLMVMGWKAAIPEAVYEPPTSEIQVIGVLMILSFYLFGAAHGPSNVKRYIRHPMLTGVIVWGIAHLLANGDNRSIILFGGMIIWAVVEILVINKRDGAYEKPEAVPMKKDAVKLAIAVVIYGVVFFIHPYIAGVPVVAM